MTSSAGAWERFLPRGGPTNTKNEILPTLKILLYKISILGGARPPRAPPGPRCLYILTHGLQKYYIT